jgi:uncharacterized membrane protein
MRKWIPVLVVIAALAASVFTYQNLPDTIPTHWDLEGNVNGWSSRFWGAFGLPLIMVAVYAVMRFLPLIDPRRENYAKFQGAYEGIILTVLVFMFAMHVLVLRAATGHGFSMEKVMPIGLGLLFIAIGNLLPRARSNFFVGIRTPWTLSSEKSWEKTHRLGGYVFVIVGILMAVSSFMPIETGWPIVAGLTAVAMLGLVVYSYVAWRDDPDKRGVFGPRADAVK